MKTVVVAGSHREFVNYCQANGIDRHRDKDVICATSFRSLWGLDGPVESVWYGTWYLRADLQEIQDGIIAIKAKYGEGQ